MENTIQIGDKVYRRQPWRGHANALVLLGENKPTYDADGKQTGMKFVPVKRVATRDPLKASKLKTKGK